MDKLIVDTINNMANEIDLLDKIIKEEGYQKNTTDNIKQELALLLEGFAYQDAKHAGKLVFNESHELRSNLKRKLNVSVNIDF